jgi:hypothetical protein
MKMLDRASETPSDLIGAIHQIRRRWRYKLMLRGAVGVLGLGALALALSAWGLESWRFSPGSIITFRVLILAAFAALVGWFIVRPLLWRVTDEQVAMYLEEHEPSLQAEIISAIEASRLAASDNSPHSKLLVDRLVQSAIAKCQAIDWGRNVERSPLRQYGMTVGVIAVAAIALFSLGPRFLRHGLSALLVISRSVEAAAPYRIDVQPGNATVPRGVDQTVTATLSGFDASEASLMVRKNADAPFERLPLVRSESGGEHKYEGMLFDLPGNVDYFVEAEGVKSPLYKLKVVDLPYVQKLELEFHFPAYTGMSPKKIEDGGDIAVLKGTEVRVKVTPTMAAKGGQILVHDALKVPLTVGPDGTMTGAFTADKDGFYRFELDATTGEHVAGSPQYTIDVLADQPPTVSISKPGRDTSASPIEEVFVEAKAEDDFGVKDLELVYSVNGAAEKTVRLFDGKNRLAEVTAGHTFYLEELDVKPGDFVSYFARAADNDQGGGKRQTSDIYFLQIRPLRKEFRRAESQGGGGGGGGGQQNQVGALSQQQRQIIAATFNINRDRKTMSSDKARENATVVGLSQSKLRDQVEGLLTRMNSRLVQQDPSFKKIADLLPIAVTEMKNAEAKLQKADPQGALEPEQKALQALQKAEEEYEIQVQAGRQQGGGGGGGGQNQLAQDLADLFELELDKMANQYETAQRAQQQQSDQKLDELMEKLKELARRQEQEAERQRRRLQAGQSGSGGGEQQRTLAEQAEEAARRLEQLSREENRPELAETARQLRQAADNMRQASANGSSGAAAAASALDKLQDAQRKMQQSQAGRADRDVKDLQRQVDDIARDHQQISDDVKALANAGQGRQEKVQQLTERKNQLESKVAQLEQSVEKKSTELARTERDASRKLSEAATSMRENRVRDKVRYSRALIRSEGQESSASAMEQDIGNTINEVQKKIGEAASALTRGEKPNTTANALEKARELARGMESMDQRLRERTGQQAQNGQNGQNGHRVRTASRIVRANKGSRVSKDNRDSKAATVSSRDSQGNRARVVSRANRVSKDSLVNKDSRGNKASKGSTDKAANRVRTDSKVRMAGTTPA